ncbi:MAG TPA: nidogen-like domain-containing protein [Pseudolysinimonas sp.]|nr:nidogen-like domain-containing protein [Pseudolysinimonas sp.]
MNAAPRRRFLTIALALAAATALAVGIPTTASAATQGVGDVTDAMRYDVAGPIGLPLADLSGEDDETTTVAAPFPINFFGVASGGVCVTTNGGFYPVPTAGDSCSDAYDKNLENLALDSGSSIIAALAGDLDLSECDNPTPDGFGIPCEIYFGTTTVDGRDAFAITWYRVPMYTGDNDPALSNTFQIVIVKKATGSDVAGWDFDIEYNYGNLTDGEDGYSAADPSSDCEGDQGDPDCRWGIGWANYLAGPPESADPYELFPSTPVFDLVDSGATPMTKNSLNSPVLGRYTFAMVGGVTQGFSVPTLGDGTPAPAAEEAPAAPELAESGAVVNGAAPAGALTAIGLGLVFLLLRNRMRSARSVSARSRAR